MQFEYLGMNINYTCEGSGQPLIMLHGWGSNLKTFDAFMPALKNNYQVYRIDLPGFGESDDLFEPFSLNDYVMFLHAFIQNNQIETPILFGHSFGGKIIIRYAAKGNPASKIILVDSAGIKKRFDLGRALKVYSFKMRKWWYRLRKDDKSINRLYESSGSADYRQANMVMKATLSKVVRTSVRSDLKRIFQDVLLIWGKQDAVTPYKDALIMKRLLVNSGLVTFDESGHFPYLEESKRFLLVLESYLGITQKNGGDLDGI